MDLFDMFKNNDSDMLNDTSYIVEYRHISGPWQQYDFYLTSGYGWDYMVDSAEYMASADLKNIGTVSVSAISGAQEEERVNEYRTCDSSFKTMPSLKHEWGVLGIGGVSQVSEGAPVKLVWFNQTRMLRMFTPVDDEDKALRYAETVIRRSFNTHDAMKKAKPVK